MSPSSGAPVDPHFTYHRVIAVIPLVGTGKAGDPIRPDHVPLPGQGLGGQDGIIAFYQEVSDDGKWALTEIVARNRAALLPILNDKRPGVWAVEKGTVSREQILSVFQRLKKNIDIDSFGAVVR